MVSQALSAPYPHQTEAVQAVLSAFESQDKAHIVMACGTGKTRVALWVAEALHARRIVIFVPSLALINQFIKEWLSVSQNTKKYCLAICSDETVTRNVDQCVLDPSECACPVTTDPKSVRHFLEKNDNHVQWVFCTYHSSGVLAEAVKDYPFDLGIFDEAHRTANNSDQFGVALMDEKVWIRKRLFMTATPKHYDIQTKTKTKKSDKKLAYSMDDEFIYGPRAYTLPFRKAIDLGLISDYKVIISVIDSPETLTDENFYSAIAVALNKSFSQAPSVSKIVSFHRTIEDAQLFQGYLACHKELPDFKPLHVNSFVRSEFRRETMDLFKLSSKALITNARCLTEGIDMPAVDMVAFLNKKRSKIDIVQAIGRCLRKSPGKTHGYIFIPLFLASDQEEALESGIERTAYREVWEVVQALSEQDEDLHATILNLKENTDNKKGFFYGLKKYINIVADPKLNPTSYHQLKEQVSIKIMDKVASVWDLMYAKLCDFKAKYGHCNVTSSLTTDKSFLGWISRTRQLCKNKTLVPHKIKILESMGFELWPIDLKWENSFQMLKNYQEKQGRCNVPQSFDAALGRWIVTQRTLYHQSKLQDFKIQRLNALGFHWDSKQVRWDRYFEKLKDYKKQHGHCRVSSKSIALQSWVGTQRQRYKKGTLEPRRIESLKSLGFELEPFSTKWEGNFAALKAYHQETSHCNVLVDHVLRTWTDEQRAGHKEGVLGKVRIDLLEQLGFNWNLANDRWQKNFEKLKKYHAQHGHFELSKKYEDKKLVTWVNGQRQRYKRKQIPDYQVTLLNTLGFSWDPKNQGWNQYFEKLRNYKKIHGDCYVDSMNGNSDLYDWCYQQRRNRKNGYIKQEKIQLLNEIGFVWDPWDFFFNKLKTYFNENGHCYLPNNNPSYLSLAQWLKKQIKLYKNGVLEPIRIKLLEEIKFSFQSL